MHVFAYRHAFWFGIGFFTSSLRVAGLSVPAESPILWNPCPDASSFECGFFQVPLDYALPNVGNATLAIARLKATKSPRLGTIFTNPGGPGLGGIDFLLGRAGTLIQTITQGHYDVVSWDPRGVSQSSPQISCGFTSLESYELFLGNTIPLVGVEARGNFTDHTDIHAFFAKEDETDAKLVQMGKKCLESDGEFLKYMGTAAVVRDMVALSDSIEGACIPINYWAFSYGTVIGNYFVNMFPERVGRVVLDGVVDSIIWATEPTYKIAAAALSASEVALQGFADECARAGPQNCTFSQGHTTAPSILRGIQNLIDTAYDLNKAHLFNATSFGIRAFIGSELYTPMTWYTELVPQLGALEALFGNEAVTSGYSHSRRGAIWPRQNTNSTVVDPTVQTSLSELVISCIDSIDQEDVTTAQFFKEILHTTHDVAPTFGEIVLVTGQLFCHRFPVRAVERFTGPFNHALPNPIVIIGNRADPATPLANALKIASVLGPSARLIKQNGIGHTSLGENSACSQSAVRDYFLYGKLPQIGLVCETDQALFPPNNTLVSMSPHNI